ncbi:hypothetical protein MRB53_006214 [Persea americana]|uniref:Uncharacterized protein n=1 Tax=Persea americana TaxID=3435 RepID=A0ACC2MGJ5_PERAE|nr:hypothetical protein MRB53_006214 [Persea americana]
MDPPINNKAVLTGVLLITINVKVGNLEPFAHSSETLDQSFKTSLTQTKVVVDSDNTTSPGSSVVPTFGVEEASMVSEIAHPFAAMIIILPSTKMQATMDETTQAFDLEARVASSRAANLLEEQPEIIMD